MGKLTAKHVEQYHEQGFVIVDDVFTDADLQPVIDCIDEVVDARARKLKAEGKIDDICEDEDFTTRFASIYAQCEEINAAFDIMLLRPRPLFDFLFNDNLLDACESILGPELECNPIQHLRPKLPVKITGESRGGMQNVPWHQDAAVTWEEADPTDIITCWFPLVDANAENGCMQILPGVHTRGYIEHQKEGGTTVRPDLLPDVEPVTAECPKRGVVFMNKYTPHLGLFNTSDHIRWSMDLRYQKSGMPSGRPFWPSIVVRSEENPASVQDSYEEWCERWEKDLAQAAGIGWHRTVPMKDRVPQDHPLAARAANR